MKQKIDLIKYMRVWGTIFLSSLAIVVIGIEVIENYQDFNDRAERIRRDFIINQKEIIKQEVLQTVDYINYKLEKVGKNNTENKKDLLEAISRIRFGKEGYIFINKYNGDALVSNGIPLSGDKKLWEIVSSNKGKMKELFDMELEAALKPEGDFIYYSFQKFSDINVESPKVSFIYGISDLEWLIGAGVYLDDIEKEIALIKDEFSSSFVRKVFYEAVIFIFAIAIVFFLFNILYRKLSKDMTQFYLFFKNAPIKSESINTDRLRFLQLEDLAKSANTMLQEKILVENELIKERENLAVTLKSIGDGLITTDKLGNVVMLNPIAEKLTGWKLEDAKGKKLSDIFNIVNFETNKKVKNPVNKVLETGEVSGLANNTKLISKNGNEYQISDSAAPIKDFNEKIIGVVLVFRDVTEEFRLNKEIVESKERYNRLSDLTYEGILIHKDGVVVDVNAALCKISGYSPEELIGINIIELLIPAKYHSLLFANMQNKIATPYEIEGIRKNGTIARLEVESRNIIYADSTANIRVTAIRDITKRKESEHEIVKLSNAIHQSPVSVIITDISGIIEYVNPNITTVTGYSFDELVGQTPSIFKSGSHLEIFYKNLWDTILSGKEWIGELHNRKKSGELFWESAVISPIKDSEGVITHFVAIKEDITEKKKMLIALVESKEKAETADKMKSIFLAQMSHEIRTPINALIGMSSLLKYDLEETATPDQLISFDIIDRAGNRIIRTVDLLLNLSDVQSGTYQCENKKINLYTEVLADLVSINRLKAIKEGIEINLKNTALDTEIVGDSYTIEQIFEQLLDNAIKFTMEGKVNVKIFRNDNDQLTVEVIDSGIGISDEYFPKLFQPFTQEEMGYTRKFEGNGIGLSLVKTYCDINNAVIEVESKKNIGSVFRVIFQNS